MTANASQIGITSEYIVTTEALKRGYNILQPVGNYLPYDFAIDIDGMIIKMQVKTLRRQKSRKRDRVDQYCCLATRTIYNHGKRSIVKYKRGDFDFAAIVLRNEGIFIVPFEIFTKKNTFVVGPTKKREEFCFAWHLLEEFASNAQRFEQSAFNPHLSEFDSL